ncbi:TonB-dependent receptor [Parabacteroides sp.]
MKIKTLLQLFIVQNNSIKDFFRIMRISLFLLFVCVFQLMATDTEAQNAVINIQQNSLSIKQLIKEIEKQTDYLVVFRNQDVDVNKVVSFQKRSGKVSDYLEEVSENANFSYVFENNYITLSRKAEAISQNEKRITGKVTDQNGEPIIGANVLEKGHTINGTVTDIDGKFSLNISEHASLLISYIGYATQEVAVRGKNDFNIVLMNDFEVLDEVVVVGYGTQKKVNLTGAVGSVRPEDLGDVQTSSVSSMIKGHLSGVQITQNNGKPGAGSTIRIRGVGTLGEDKKNDPLLVVDGQAVDYGIETIDPNDIESVNVLKDASSAAIYGARAANGVLLITTKRGAKGVGKLSVNAYLSVQTMMKKYDMLNAEEYVTLQNEARKNAGMGSMFSHEPTFYGKGTDWIDEITQLAPVQEYNVNFSKGTDLSNYYISGTFHSQDGIVKNTGYDKASFRFNGDVTVLPKLKVGNSITLTWNETSGSSTPLGDALVASPTIPVKNEDGSWGIPTEAGEGGVNPVYKTELYKGNKSTMWRALANMYAEYRLLDELKFKVTGAIDFAAQNKRAYYPKVSETGEYTEFSDQKLEDNMSLGYTWQNDYLLYFDKDWGKHHVDGLLGMSLQASQEKEIKGTVRGFLNDEEYMQVLDAGQRDWRATGGLDRWAMLSYFGNINYNFDSRYLFSFNLRVDGSSRFGKNNKYGYFPSASVAWRINSESFMKDIKWISNLKLRASYGSLGNQEIGLYSFTDQLDVNQWYLFGNGLSRIPGVSSLNMIDPNIKWETTTITNLGVDFGILDNTLSMVAEYYIKDTHDILLTYPIPTTVGKSAPTVNAGKVRNNGFEMELRYNNHFGDLWLNTSLIYGYNHNEVKELIQEQSFLSKTLQYNVIARSEIGHPINSIYGYVMDGIYQTEEEIAESPTWAKAEVGTIKFKDLNDDGVINDEDRTFIANTMPHSTLGFNLSLKYKNFDFSMFWQGDFGKKIFWGDQGNMRPLYNWRNVNSLWLERWTGAGSTNEMPKLKYNLDYLDTSSFHIKSTDYFRLKNLSFGYTFDFKDNIKARLYIAGQNLLTLTSFPGIDPEISDIFMSSSSYPQSRSYTIGLNINF